jgi:hypothetical protein
LAGSVATQQATKVAAINVSRKRIIVTSITWNLGGHDNLKGQWAEESRRAVLDEILDSPATAGRRQVEDANQNGHSS